jgi:hypothetical protein
MLAYGQGGNAQKPGCSPGYGDDPPGLRMFDIIDITRW